MNGMPISSLAQFQTVFGTRAGEFLKGFGIDIGMSLPPIPAVQEPEIPQELLPGCEPGRLMTGYPDVIADSYRPAIPQDQTPAHRKLLEALEAERRLPSGPPRGYLQRLKYRRVEKLYEKSIAALDGADPYNAAIARARLGIFEAMKLGNWRGLRSRLSWAGDIFANTNHYELASRCMYAGARIALTEGENLYGLLEMAAGHAETAIDGEPGNLTARIRALDAWIACIEMAARADGRSFWHLPIHEYRDDFICRRAERALLLIDKVDCAGNPLAAAWICEDLERLAGIVYQGLGRWDGTKIAANIFSKASSIAEISGDKKDAARYARQASHMFALRSNHGWKEHWHREDLRYEAASSQMKRAAELSSDDNLAAKSRVAASPLYAAAEDWEAAGWFALAHAERGGLYPEEREPYYGEAALCFIKAADAYHLVVDDDKADQLGQMAFDLALLSKKLGKLLSREELAPILKFLSEKMEGLSLATTKAAITSLFDSDLSDFKIYEVNRNNSSWRLHETLFYQSGVFKKFEALVRLLVGESSLEGATVIENGPGSRAITSAILALMGANVVVKEPDESEVTSHRQFVAEINEAARGRISYRATREEIDRPSPARLVVWANPSLHDLVEYLGMNPHDDTILEREMFGKLGSKVPAYLSRDVEEGGYLVVQTEITERLAAVPPGDPEWEDVWSGKAPFMLMPTLHHGGTQYVYIYRRKTSKK